MIKKEWLIKEVLPKFKSDYRIYEYLMLKDFLYDGNDNYKEKIKDLLNKQQNDDGGFPGFFEPDIRSNNSSVISTVNVLNLYAYNGGIEDYKVKEKVKSYLENKFNNKYMGWHILSGNVFESPRAGWWNKEFENTFNYPNPTANIIGLNKVLNLNLKIDNIEEIYERMINKELNTDNMHDYKSLIMMFNLLNKNVPLELIKSGLKIVEWDEGKWDDYCLGPSDVINNKDNPFYEIYKDMVNKHLKYKSNKLLKNKYIDTSWTWNQYEDYFFKAKNEWRGILTFSFIKVLDNFNLID